MVKYAQQSNRAVAEFICLDRVPFCTPSFCCCGIILVSFWNQVYQYILVSASFSYIQGVNPRPSALVVPQQHQDWC